MHEPYFSIIVATYNRAGLVKRALNSIMMQTNKDWEAIVVDDGSTDGTRSAILSYTSSDPRIRYLCKNHSGAALSKNAGIASSTGRFITFLDSDDEFDPAHLESRRAILIKNPLVRFLYGGARILGNQFVPDRFDSEKSVRLDDCIIGGTFFVERNTLVKLGGFRNLRLGEDADLLERAVDAGISISETTLQTYIYHHEIEDSVTNILYSSNQELVG